MTTASYFKADQPDIVTVHCKDMLTFDFETDHLEKILRPLL